MSIPPAIRERLRTAIGLDASTLGEATLRAAWQHRLAATSAESEADYLALLRRAPGEFDSLVEELLVPESWFFRDGVPFKFLESWVRQQWLPQAGVRVLRVLSVPCAAGQEPYSIAMALCDAGLRPRQFFIQAGDASERSLALARAGLYPASSFRGRDATGRDHHFESAPQHRRQVSEEIRAAVRFSRCNLVAPDFFRGEAPFQIVFCRNVLIYFDAESRRRTLGNLRRLLAPDGLMFTGHADSLSILDSSFVSAGPSGSFVYQLRPTAVPPAPAAPRRRTGRTRSPLRQTAPSFPSAASRLVSKTPPAAASEAGARAVATLSDPAATVLADARRLADAGVFDEAETRCRQLTQARQPHPGAFFLLGQIAAARGRPADAENFYRKALYLDSNHPEALQQLALLTERRGDRAGAARYRARAKN